MKLSSFFIFPMAILMALSPTFALITEEGEDVVEYPTGNQQSAALRGMGRTLAQGYPKFPLTCDRNPRICRAQGSAGPDCCKKQCVNVKKDSQNCGLCGKKCKKTEACCGGWCINLSSDRLNCGACRKKCKFTESCCGGSCVKISSDARNCGRCGKKCRKGSYCLYGLCGYA